MVCVDCMGGREACDGMVTGEGRFGTGFALRFGMGVIASVSTLRS